MRHLLQAALSTRPYGALPENFSATSGEADFHGELATSTTRHQIDLGRWPLVLRVLLTHNSVASSSRLTWLNINGASGACELGEPYLVAAPTELLRPVALPLLLRSTDFSLQLVPPEWHLLFRLEGLLQRAPHQ